MNNVFVYPTETSYGIGCDARDAAAVGKIFAIKGRDPKKPMPLIASSQRMVETYIRAVPSEVTRVMKDFWPGPFTLVLKANAHAKKVVAPGIIASDGTIAIRVPDHEIARALAKQHGAPIVATSANKAGKAPCYSASAVRRVFSKEQVKPDIVIDVGALKKQKPSTIAEFKHKQWHVLRAGSISL